MTQHPMQEIISNAQGLQQLLDLHLIYSIPQTHMD